MSSILRRISILASWLVARARTCSSPWPLSWNEIFSRCTGRSAGKCSGPAECLLRSVQIALLLEHHAERVVSFGVVRFQCNSCGKLPKSGLQIPQLGPYQSQIEVTRRVVRIDAQGRIKLFSGVVDRSLLAQSDSQVVVGIHVFRIRLQRETVLGNRHIQFTLLMQKASYIVMGFGRIRSQS